MEIVPSGGTLNQMVRRIHRLHSLPAVGLRVLQLTSKSDVDPRELCECVESDPALCAKILAVVNGSLCPDTRVVNLTQAIALLGVRRLQLLVLGMSLPAGLFSGVEAEVLSYYWRFSLYKSFSAKRLAQRVAEPEDADTAFVAALLQDCGMLAMIQELGAPYLDFLRHILPSAGTDILRLETETLGFDHRILGAKLMAQWQLPDILIALTKQRHDADAIAELVTPLRSIAEAIHVADVLAHFWILGTPELGTEAARLASLYWNLECDEVAKQFNVCLGVDGPAAGGIEREVNSLAKALHIGHDEWPQLVPLIRSAHTQLAFLAEQLAREPCTGGSVAREHSREAMKPPNCDMTAANTRHHFLSPTNERPVQTLQSLSVAEHAADSSTASDQPTSPSVSKAAAVRLPDINDMIGEQLAEARRCRSAISLVLVELEPLDRWLLLQGPDVMTRVVDALQADLEDADFNTLPGGISRSIFPVSPATIAIILPGNDRNQITQWTSQVRSRLQRSLINGRNEPGALPNLWFGVAALSYVPKGFEPSRLIEPAERCLRVARQIGGANTKSIDVL